MGKTADPVLGPFWGPFWDQIGPRRAKRSPRWPSRGSKIRKAAFPKTLKNPNFFKVFGVQRLPNRVSRGTRRLPRGTHGAPKPPKKQSTNGSKI